MSQKAILENRLLRLEAPVPKLFIKAARVVEGLSKLTEMTVDFMAADKKLDLGAIVGRVVTVKIKKSDDEGSGWREFVGHCIEGQFIGLQEGYGYYSIECRPWLWFLTRNRNNRIFQNVSAKAIIEQVFSDAGFSNFDFQLNRSPQERVYTVQYNESDFDFVSRLMEEEGIYYYFTHGNMVDKMMLVDDIGGHSPVENAATIEYAPREKEYRRTTDHIFEWRGAEAVTSGKVTLTDWNFEKPKADLKTVKAIPKGQHSQKNHEIYRYPGHYRETALGEIYARVEMEANAAKHQLRDAIGNVRTLANGRTFKLKGHFRDAENTEYLIANAVHMMQVENADEDQSQKVEASKQGDGAAKLPGTIKFDEENKDAYRCTFKVLPKTVPFRTVPHTPWPKIPGILIARVTGPAGEEIYTDKYGRIKVQFPWDREGQNDENTTCWVRVVTPWSGKQWGMIAVPRIGQEVVIQFEDGDPDRPICTGMLYNTDTMPPYGLPDNKTQSGVKTRSSKGGGADNFNEFVMEDKKDEEFVRLQSEKDYVEIIKNNATITIGMEKKDPGDYTQTIYANRSEFVKTGDSTFKVEAGNEIRYIKSDKTEDIDGSSEKNIKGDETKDTGGKFTETVMGAYKSTVTGGITIESMQSIELKVGGSLIKIDHAGVTVKGVMIKTDASTMNEMNGSAMVKIQGGITMIN